MDIQQIQEIFSLAFGANFIAVVKVFMIAAIAAALIRTKVLNSEQVGALTAVTVNILLPSMMFANICRNFKPEATPGWWMLPLTAMVTIASGILLGRLFFCREYPAKKNMLAIAGIQNAAYLVLPIGKVLYPDQFADFSGLCFLYIMGMNYMLWSVGKFLTTSAPQEKIHFGTVITPPFVAGVVAITLVFLGWNRHIPAVVLDPIDILGQATVPLATFILGGVLGGVNLRLRPYLWDTIRVISIKQVIVPAATVAVLFYLRERVEPLTARLLVLQAAAAPATGLILQVRKYGGDVQKISSVMLANYLACMGTMPLWMAVWEVCSRF